MCVIFIISILFNDFVFMMFVIVVAFIVRGVAYVSFVFAFV